MGAADADAVVTVEQQASEDWSGSRQDHSARAHFFLRCLGCFLALWAFAQPVTPIGGALVDFGAVLAGERGRHLQGRGLRLLTLRVTVRLRPLFLTVTFFLTVTVFVSEQRLPLAARR